MTPKGMLGPIYKGPIQPVNICTVEYISQTSPWGIEKFTRVTVSYGEEKSHTCL